ncbi:tyrosine-type recombinase/integrase [Novosphingobium sp. ST904]|uniref:tyrosine-type recombinase/integrase n=1 Tax=Novosphingobium sp. ST904 TaxID=1684385 RepID=UPI0006C86E6B|nr:tyrosine-type recombinase/integrase [Novosphingobium sp. ST904]TCM23805.1 site-specific recombinase XerD [Novosphingobium sp. ST904]
MADRIDDRAGRPAMSGLGNALVVPGDRTPGSVTPLAAEVEAARSYRLRARSANTLRAYASDWRQFEDWCWGRGLEPLPAAPEVVATYLASLALAGRADSTVTRHLAAITWRHRHDGVPPPSARDTHQLIADTLSGIRREQRARPTRKKAAIGAKDLAGMIARADGLTTRDVRDRAILALGLAAALRRSELVALQLADVQLVEQGLTVRVGYSKTDPEGEGATIAVPAGRVLRPVAHLNAWLAVRGGAPGPLFTRIGTKGEFTLEAMSDRSVARLVKRYASLQGLDPETIAGHSLRAGFLTEAARTRASLAKMQEVSRHKSLKVLLGYVRSAERFDDHAGAGFL